MNLLRKSHFCSFSRLFSLNSRAIRLKQSKNCPKNGFLSLRSTKSGRLLKQAKKADISEGEISEVLAKVMAVAAGQKRLQTLARIFHRNAENTT